jgi:uncharacterized protein (TIGR03083 family)
MMEHDEYTAAIRREGHALTGAATRAGVDASVPSCPQWHIGDLLGHVGRIHRWVTAVITNGPDAPSAHWSANDPPANDEVLAWFAGGVDPLADALLGAGPNVEVWSWTPDHSTGFWARRMANETAVHRYDAELAGAAAAPITLPLSVDGIDEFFDLLPFWRGAENVRGNGETLHFHCTDADGEWLARLDSGGFAVTRQHAKGDVAARGTASDLMLFLYGRVPASELEVFGDAELLARWRELVRW